MSNRPISPWHTSKNREEYEKALIERIINRAEKYYDKGYIKSAIKCYEGFLGRYPICQEVQIRLGSLYSEIGNEFKAGRYFYFKEDLTELEAHCVSVFEKQFGNDPILIVKCLLNKERHTISKLDSYSQWKLNKLIQVITKQLGTTPRFLAAARRHFEKLSLE